MSEYYVYAYLRPNRQSPYYIGKGRGNRVNNTHPGILVPPHNRRVIIKNGLTNKESLVLENLLVEQWGRVCYQTGVLLNKRHGFLPGTSHIGNRHNKGNTYKIKERFILKKRERKWWNDGESNYHRAKCPPGCVAGRLGKWKRDNRGTNNPRAQSWKLTYVDGSVMIISALKEWCRTQPDISYGGLYYAFQHKTSYKNIITEVIKI